MLILGEKAGQLGLSSEECGVAAEFCERCRKIMSIYYMIRSVSYWQYHYCLSCVCLMSDLLQEGV